MLLALVGCDRVFGLGHVEPARGVDGPPSSCPAAFDGARYLFVAEPLGWGGAQAACVALLPDSQGPMYTHLAVLSSVLELSEVASLRGGTSAWVGLTDLVVRGSYQWVTTELPRVELGDPMWGPAEPDGGDNNGCVKLTGGNGLLDDASCSQPNAYLCECDAFPEDRTRFDPASPPAS